MKSISEELNLNNKKILLRLDLNVPLVDDKITDTTRIDKILPTINFLLSQNTKIIIISHVGRPKGKDPELSLIHIVKAVESVLEKPVLFTNQVIGEKTTEIVKNSKPGQIVLIENLRYYPQEEEGNNSFAKELSKLAGSYVNDAFGTAHRAHASTSVVAEFFKGNKIF